MPNSSFGFGSSLTNDFCIEQSDDILQLSKKLYQYGESRKYRMFIFIFYLFLFFIHSLQKNLTLLLIF